MILIGTLTVILYLVSLTFFFLGMIYPNFVGLFMTFCAMFFIIPSVIIGFMVKDRVGT